MKSRSKFAAGLAAAALCLSTPALVDAQQRPGETPGQRPDAPGQRLDTPGQRLDTPGQRVGQTQSGQRDQVTRVHKTSNLVGADVKDRQNQSIGKISDVVIDFESGRVAYVVLTKETGAGQAGQAGAQPGQIGRQPGQQPGQMGQQPGQQPGQAAQQRPGQPEAQRTEGQQRIAVPIQAFRPSTDQQHLVLQVDRQRLDRAEVIRGEQFPSLRMASDAQVRAQWGITITEPAGAEVEIQRRSSEQLEEQREQLREQLERESDDSEKPE